MSDSPFITDFRALLSKHGITHPAFAHGAKPFNPDKPQVLYSGPVYDDEEIVAGVRALVEGKWAVAGEYTHRFERLFSSYLNQTESVAVNSGSSADLLMVAAAKKRFGWRDGDGIIVSPTNFPTTISAITLNKLTPVFVDIEWDTLNADNDSIERVLVQSDAYLKRREEDVTHGHELIEVVTSSGVRTVRRGSVVWMGEYPPIRAILVSPVLGNPPNMDKLTELAAYYGVKLLLDGCDSLGSTWRGKHLATYCAASTCSLFPSHHISTLQGGMISSNDMELIRWARRMAAWSRDCYCVGAANMLPKGTCGCRFKEWLPETQPGVILDHKYRYVTDQAYNLQQVDLLSAIGCVQMGKLDAIHEARRAAWQQIGQYLVNHLGGRVRIPWAYKHANPSWFGVPVVCPNYPYKAALVAHLESHGVQVRNYFAGNILCHEGYRHLGNHLDYPNSNEVLKRVFFLGCSPGLTQLHFTHIEEIIKSFRAP